MSDEENFADIDERQPYIPPSPHLALDLHIRAPKSPRSLQGSPSWASERRNLKQLPEVKLQSTAITQVRSASPRRTAKGLESRKQDTRVLQRCTTHQPSLSPKSQRLKRDNKVEDILYQDAMRRMLKPQPPPAPTYKPAISPRSEELLAEALIREVECA